MSDVRERIAADWLLFDSALMRHGYAAHLRDYHLVIDVPSALLNDDHRSFAGRHRYCFTHCVVADVATALTPEIWRASWDDVLLDRIGWEAAGEPDGFVWGVNWSDAYPGLRYVDDSTDAQWWTAALEREMHEVQVETNAQTIRLVFHDFSVRSEELDGPEPDFVAVPLT